jgi:hypothetical protein
MQLSHEDRVWNRAAVEGGGPSPAAGDRALSSLLLVHGLVMNGGVEHAIEVLSPNEVGAAILGFRYFEFVDVAELLQSVVSGKLRTEDTDQRYWDLIPDDEAIAQRFKARFKLSPTAFAPLDGAQGQ